MYAARPKLFSQAVTVRCCLFSPRILLFVGAFIAAIALTSFITNEVAARRNDSDRQSLAVALSSLRASNVRASLAEDRVAALRARGDTAERQVAMYEAVARRSTERSTEAWARFEAAVKENVCDSSCINAARVAHTNDSIALAAKDSALSAEKVASARYKLGLDEAVKALADLRFEAMKVDTAAKPFVKKPWNLRRILPKLGVSATAGFDRSGKLNAVVGPSLSYNF